MVLHLGAARIGEDRAPAERARPPLVSPMEDRRRPCPRPAIAHFFGNIGAPAIWDVVDRQRRLDHRLPDSDPEIGRIAIAVALARSPGRASPTAGQRQARRRHPRRRDEYANGCRDPDHPRIGGAVERDTAGKAEIPGAEFADQRRQQMSAIAISSACCTEAARS